MENEVLRHRSDHYEETHDLKKEMGLDDHEIAYRKAWLEFTEEDAKRLTGLNEMAQGYANEVIEELYQHFLKFDDTRKFLKIRELCNM
jgi:hypothetical protein